MKSTPKFLRYINRGGKPVNVIPSVSSSTHWENNAPIHNVVFSMLEQGKDKPGMIHVVMSIKEARQLSASLNRFSDKAERKDLLPEQEIIETDPV